MTMKGLPLACFDKPTFEADGLAFFVCNGGGGISGVRKANTPSGPILVRDPDIAQNLNMQIVKRQCLGKRFSVGQRPDGEFYFGCEGRPSDKTDRFQVASKTQWKQYDSYLNK